MRRAASPAPFDLGGIGSTPAAERRGGGSRTLALSRRAFLGTAAAGAGLAAWLGSAGRVGAAQGPRAITASHSVSTFVYGAHLVAVERKLFEEEGLRSPDVIVPGGGARVMQAVAAGRAMFGLGDCSHPLRITAKGQDSVVLFTTDRRCSYANVVVRQELFNRGVTTVEALADQGLVGRRAVIAATAIGSGTHVYGVYVLGHTRAPDGRPVHDHVEWASGGASVTMLGGLRAGKFDAIMAVPEWQSAAVDRGFGMPIYDVQDEKAWNRVFGGPIPVTVGYCLKETAERSADLVQGYVNACYRAQQWIRGAEDEEIVDILWKPYLGTFSRDEVLTSVRYYRKTFDWDLAVAEQDYARGEKVWIPIALEKPVPYARAVDMSFLRNADESRRGAKAPSSPEAGGREGSSGEAPPRSSSRAAAAGWARAARRDPS